MSLLATALLSTTTALAGPQLITPGLHMAEDLGDTAAALGADGWHALVEDEDGFQLVATALTVDRLPHPLTDAAALRIHAETPGEVRFLVRGVPTARPGRVPTTYAGARALVPGTWQAVGYAPDAMTVLVAADIDGQTDSDLVDPHSPAHLLVQRFAVTEGGGTGPAPATVQDLGPVDGTAHLLWAGDLDGDGVTDLLLDETHHTGATRARLWLSSEAGGAGLVAEAAVLETTGC
jgi:hypothetical protein